ncbi:hypothetical protein AX16_009838 [Volvariella volvacea WC 439]|nr:hypothetical protein AX16_009838 [Volvariella volvacea WC 439]
MALRSCSGRALLQTSASISYSVGLLHPNTDAVPHVRFPGIKRIGTSHLLIPVHKAAEFVRFYNSRLATPYPTSSGGTPERLLSLTLPRSGEISPANFESLSPIIFTSADQLHKKLAYLKPGGGPWDNSRANKGYCNPSPSSLSRIANGSDDDADGLDEMVPEGVMRSAFEQGRLLYHCLLSPPSPSDTADYNLLPNLTQALSHLRVVAFSFNRRSPDERAYQDRILHPSLVDIGWAEASLPHFILKPGSARHIVDKQNRFLRGKGKKLPFDHGTTLEMDRDETSAMLHNWVREFADANPASAGNRHAYGSVRPTILLVFNKVVTLNILNNYGVDVSRWEVGLKGLLYSHSMASRYNKAPIYIIDMQQLFIKLMKTTYGSESTGSIARYLKMPTAKDGYCAGNEAVLLIDIWRSMISSLPIDEQGALRRQLLTSTSRTPSLNVVPLTPLTSAFAPPIQGDEERKYVPPLREDHAAVLAHVIAALPNPNRGGYSGGGGDEDDDEFDPNDIVQDTSAGGSRGVGVGHGHGWHAPGYVATTNGPVDGGALSVRGEGSGASVREGKMYAEEDDDDDGVFEED